MLGKVIKIDGMNYEVVKTYRRHVWTRVMDARLAMMKDHSTRELAKIFDCDQQKVVRRLKVLNLSNPPFWTLKRDGMLLKHYKKMGNQELAHLIGCSASHVADRLTLLGKKRPRGWQR